MSVCHVATREIEGELVTLHGRCEFKADLLVECWIDPQPHPAYNQTSDLRLLEAEPIEIKIDGQEILTGDCRFDQLIFAHAEKVVQDGYTYDWHESFDY